MAVGISHGIGIGMKKCCGGGSGNTRGTITVQFRGTTCSAYEVEWSRGADYYKPLSTKISGSSNATATGAEVYPYVGETVYFRVTALAPDSANCEIGGYTYTEATLRSGNDPNVAENNTVRMTVASPNTQVYSFVFTPGVEDFVYISAQALI